VVLKIINKENMSPAPDVKEVERGFVIPIGGAVEKKIIQLFCENFVKFQVVLNIGDSNGLKTKKKLGPNYVKLFESMGAESKYIPVDQRGRLF
jgi:hypothetical protein